MSDTPAVAPLVAAIGRTIRTMRKARGMTLEQLADSARLSIGMVSQLERGNGNPSFATLAQIAHGLDVPVGRLMHIDENTSPVVRKAARRTMDGHGIATTNAEYELLTPNLDGALQATWVRSLPGHDTSDAPFRHNGEEFGVVIRGRLAVYVDGVRHDLDEGDSIRFSSTVPHWFVNDSDAVTECVWVSTPPTW